MNFKDGVLINQVNLILITYEPVEFCLIQRSVRSMNSVSENAFVNEIANFDAFGKPTVMVPFEWEVEGKKGTTMKAINEYWTSGQRQANSLHEISYRACFKPQLPEFFIQRLTVLGDGVYDPFMGRGTTPLEARLMGRKPMGNDINPLSQVLLSAAP